MSIVWKGKGFLVAVIVIAALVMTQLAVSESHAGLWAGLAFLGAGGVLIVLNRALGQVPGRLFIDPATNEPIIEQAEHSFFFLPIRVWAPICLAGGAVAALVGLFL
ncbi:MAG: hypothetical protein ACRDZ3_06050 [Acidimicrobiia bacterium]